MRWRYQAGIGEERAALVDDEGVILEARIEPDAPRLRVGTITKGRAVRLDPRFAIVEAAGHEAIVEPRPRGWTEGAAVRVEIVREALPERGATKRAKARPVGDAAPREAPSLRAQLAASGLPVEIVAPGADVFEEAAGDIRAEAQSGETTFDGGRLHVEPTRAMTLIDVDGWLEPFELIVRAADAAGRALRRMGIGGSIGIDFPTVGSRDARNEAALALDRVLPRPFERTAINGFGFMQIVRPRVRPSLIELYRDDPRGWWARLALEKAGQSGVIGASRIVASPAVVGALAARPDWLDALGRALGGPVALHPDPSLANWATYAAKA